MSFFNKSLFVKVIGLFILSVSSQSAVAKPNIQEKYDVLKQASNYAQSIACSTTFAKDSDDYKTTVKDVFLVEKAMDYEEKNEIGLKYIVFWGGDAGCAGGSGTYSNYLTSFSRDTETRPFLVEKQDILDDVNEDIYQINTRFIQDVEFYNGVLLVTSSDYSDNNTDGGNNFPRYQYRYTLVFDMDTYKWKLANKELIKDFYPNAKSHS
jgi:hypothetical protein